MTRTRLGAALVGVVAAVAVLAGCTPADEPVEAADPTSTDYFGYQVNVPLATTNAGSLEGVSTNAQLLSGRLYPAVFVPGPSGQMIPNSDLVQTQVLPGPKRQVIYTLASDAVFSDGTHVTCSDYLLAYTAGANPELFGSHLPMMEQIESLSCLPGAKQFTVVFAEGQGVRWRELFGPGTVLPSHAIAKKLNMDSNQFVEALEAGDPDQIRPIADVWRTGFDLNNFDPEMQVSFGPFRIESVGEHGEVTLAQNEHYYGDQPQLDTLVVWPAETDSRMLAGEGALRIADVPETKPEWLDINVEGNPYTVETRVGDLTDTLRFEQAGNWASTEYRRALEMCIDPRAVAKASSEVSGVEVPAVGIHVMKHNDPLARHLASIGDQHMGTDVTRASQWAGLELRVGYSAPSERKAAMVEAMRASCEPAGITVVDVTGDGKTLADLDRVTTGEWGQEVTEEGTIDAFLGAVDPMAEYPTADTRLTDIAELRAKEERLWEELPSIPLAAQPRSFVIDKNVGNVVVYTGSAGIGWNMDRWQVADVASEEETSAPE